MFTLRSGQNVKAVEYTPRGSLIQCKAFSYSWIETQSARSSSRLAFFGVDVNSPIGNEHRR
jgi:hypothetical protein